MNWYYAIEGRALGPVTGERLVSLAAENAVDSETLIWHPGMEAWEPVWKARPETVGPLSKSALAQKARGSTDRIPLVTMGTPQAQTKAQAQAQAMARTRPQEEKPAAPAKAGFWSRLFGKGKK